MLLLQQEGLYETNPYIFLVAFTTSEALAQYVYFKGSVGPSWQRSNSFAGGDIDYDPRFLGTLSLVAGYQLNPMFGAEIELASRTADIEGIDNTPWLGELDSSALMLNGNFRVPISGNFFLTFGAGLGIMSAELYDAISDEFADGSAFAAQFMIGSEIEISENFSLTFEYRRFSALDLELTGTDGVFREDLSYINGGFLMGGRINL